MNQATLAGPQTPPFGYPWSSRNSVSDSSMPAQVAAESAGVERRAAGARGRAFERDVYEQHVDRIYRLALRMTGNASKTACVASPFVERLKR